jgi:hypothetical protein
MALSERYRKRHRTINGVEQLNQEIRLPVRQKPAKNAPCFLICYVLGRRSRNWKGPGEQERLVFLARRLK